MAASIWKGSISFGLLNIPVSLKSAEEEKSLHFSLLDKKDMSRIRYLKVSAQSGKEVPSERIVKGYEYEKERFVLIDEKDFKKANVKATQTIDIEDFVLLKEVDPLLFEKPYYLIPQKGAEKGYFLLRDALKETERVAVGKVVIRVKQHLAMIMPKEDHLILEILRFVHEIREAEELQEPKKMYSEKELKMAEDLIEGMSGEWQPEQYQDTYYNDMMKLIKGKVRQGKGHISREVKVESITTTDNVVDLMPLLKKSLEASRSKSVKKGGSKRKSRSA